MTGYTDKLTPNEIATALQESRPDLTVHFGETGGGVQAMTAFHTDGDHEEAIYIGIAGGHLGWSNVNGDGGGWADLVASDEDLEAWDHHDEISQAHIIVARLADVLWRRLPPRHPRATKITGAWRIEQTPTEEAYAGVCAQIEDLDAPNQVAVLETALDEARQRLAEWEYENTPKVALELTRSEARLLWMATETLREANPDDPDAQRLDEKLGHLVGGDEG